MKIYSIIPSVCIFIFFSCTKRMVSPVRTSEIGGSEFYKTAFSFDWQQRDSFVLDQFNKGNIPSFFLNFVPISTSILDSMSGKKINATFYVSPDYFSIGTDDDWARVNITPKAAQKIADQLHCFLPTKKLVDDIYASAKIKLEPVPMYAFRDSTPTMYQHHLIIEGQRKGRKGLIAGIQKDVVLSEKLLTLPKKDRVAIYGWHLLSGKPIQPLYTGHVFWWVDYSQGIRLVYEKIRIGGKWMYYQDVLKNSLYKSLLCDEPLCNCYRYSID